MNKKEESKHSDYYLPVFEKAIIEIGQVLREHDKFLVCGHVRPDGDCIGSQLTLYYLLKNMGKQVRLYNPGPIMRHFQFVKNVDKIETTFDENYNQDVCIYVDCGAQERVLNHTKISGKIVNIDHHQSNDEFGDVNYIDPGATAAGEQLYHIIKAMGEPITKPMASCMYLSLLSDSGGFRFSNTTSTTFRVVSDLVKAGANPSQIAEGLFENRSPESMVLKGGALSRLRYECGGILAWSEITSDMYAAYGERNEPEGLVGELRGIAGVEVSILFHEIKEGGMRAGLRSRGKIDVSQIASKMGGGGHVNASGCYVLGDYTRLRDELLKIALEHMELNFSCKQKDFARKK